MATYRVRTTDGAVRTQQALRMRTDTTNLYLEDRPGGSWRPVLDLPLDRVERVQRRFTEHDGRWGWRTEALPAEPRA